MSAQGQLPLHLGAGAFYDANRDLHLGVDLGEPNDATAIIAGPCEACGAPAAWPCSPGCETQR